MFKKNLTIVSFISIILIFLALNISLLDKTPLPFSDEDFFANHAYSLTGKESLSSNPFENRLSTIAPSISSTSYGPIYYWILAIPLKFFNYNLTTVRLTSVFLGTITIIIAFFLTKTLTKSKVLSLLAMLLLSLQFHFLIAAKMARPEIAVMLFSYISFLFYVRTWNNPSSKNYLLTGLFCTISLFTHFLSGLVPIVVILGHNLLTKKPLFKKGFLLLISLPIIFSLFFTFRLFYFHPSQTKDAYDVFSQRLIPSFASLNLIFQMNIFTKARFVMFIFSFLLLLFHRKKNESQSFSLTFFFVTFLVVSYGSSAWYLGLLSFPSALCLVSIKRPPFLVAILTSLIISSSIADQTLVQFYLYLSNFSYNNFGEKVSSEIEPNSKVIISALSPDPYLYLVEKRPDLKLYVFQVIDKNNKSLSLADYAITSSSVENFLKKNQYQTLLTYDTPADQIAVIKLLK